MTKEHILALRRQSRDERRTRRCNAFATISQVPELLLLIFLDYLPKDDFAVASLSKAPLKLTLVCHHWHHLALSTPELWSGLRLRSDGFPQETARRHSEILECLPRRAGNCPLSFNLKYKRLESTEDKIRVSNVLARILPHAHRWRKIDISAPPEGLYMLLHGFAIGSRFLESVHMRSVHSPLAPSTLLGIEFPVTMDLSASARLRDFCVLGDGDLNITWVGVPPRLHRMQLEKCVFRLDNRSSTVSALKHLKLFIQSTSAKTLHEFAASFPELRSLRHCISSPMTDLTSFQEHIAFPHLRNLDILVNNITTHALDMAAMLDDLTTPSLASLRVSVIFGSGTRSWPHLATFLRRSAPPLRNLTIYANNLDEDSILNVLQYTPGVERFALFFSHMSDRTLKSLMPPSVVPPATDVRAEIQSAVNGRLCPRLTSLSLSLDPLFRTYSHWNFLLHVELGKRIVPGLVQCDL